ncbi:uncharacterized protein LOC142353462 isoform X2 [Convolutriloba macropyga]|uniref:uncharacterized protein LOC142353462 isoform X2 n=1 Tax=Convolutriloba macropyga TaxID=536237 RepID=UPI003F524F28
MYTCGCENLSVSIKSLTSSTEEESRDPLEDVEEPEWQEARIVCLQHEYTSLKITEVAQQSRTKVECEYPFLICSDSHSQLTFLSSPTSAPLSEPSLHCDDVILPCDVIFCINCRCPVFVIVINSQQGEQILFATQFTKSSARLTPEDLVLDQSGDRDLDIIEKIESLAFGVNDGGEVDSEVLNNLPPSLRIDWSKIQSKLRQLASEVAADIDTEKRAQIQKLTQLENEKASRRKSKVSSLFAAIEESISGLPRCATRHSSVSDAAQQQHQQLTTSGSLLAQQSQINIMGRINSANRGEPKGLLDEMDQFGLEDEDELGGKSGLVDDLNEEDEGYFVSSNVSDDEEAFLTESSGGSSSGIDAQNSSAMTSSQGAEIPGGRARYDDDEDDFPILSQSVSQPIYIGSHSHRSASVALDEEQNKGSGATRAHGGDLHLRMREISRSVRGDSSDIFGDLPDDHRRVDFAQIMRSYTNSSEGLFDINRDFTPSARK